MYNITPEGPTVNLSRGHSEEIVCTLDCLSQSLKDRAQLKHKLALDSVRWLFCWLMSPAQETVYHSEACAWRCLSGKGLHQSPGNGPGQNPSAHSTLSF